MDKTIFCKIKFWQLEQHEACIVKVYITKFSHCLFLLKMQEDLMSVDKMYCNESQKSLSQQVLF